MFCFFRELQCFSNIFRTRNRKYSVSGSRTFLEYQVIYRKYSIYTIPMYPRQCCPCLQGLHVSVHDCHEWQCFSPASGHEIVNTPCPAVEFSSFSIFGDGDLVFMAKLFALDFYMNLPTLFIKYFRTRHVVKGFQLGHAWSADPAWPNLSGKLIEERSLSRASIVSPYSLE